MKELNIVTKKITELIKYEQNNKNHSNKQVDLIANSIKEFGFKNPIILSKDNIIIAWHWRFEASKKLWLETVPCIIADDLTDKQVKKYRMLDNKLAELAEDNIENIKLELEELQDMGLNELYNIDIEDIDFDDIKSNEDRELNNKLQKVRCPECWHNFEI